MFEKFGDGEGVVAVVLFFDFFEKSVEAVEAFQTGVLVDEVLEVSGVFGDFFEEEAEGLIYGKVFPVGELFGEVGELVGVFQAGED